MNYSRNQINPAAATHHQLQRIDIATHCPSPAKKKIQPGGERSSHPRWPFLSPAKKKKLRRTKKKKKEPAIGGGRDPPPTAEGREI